MPKMTLAWVAVYFLAVVLAVVNPFYATLGYLFEYYLRPSLHWWGKELPDLRWNFTIAAVLTASYLVHRGSFAPMSRLPRGPVLCLVGLAAVMLLITPMAADRSLSFTRTVDFLKLLLFFGLVIGTVRTERSFDLFVSMHMLGAGWWGWEAFIDPKRTAGRLANVGSGDTLGDNFAAAHLLTVIPFIVIYALVHKDKRLRLLALAVAPFVINTFILCNSRGGVVALVAVSAAAIWLTRSGHRLRMVAVGLVFGTALFMLADPQFIQRQQSTSRYEEDGSAMERLASWRAGIRLMIDHPLGAGGGGFTTLSPVYNPDVVAANGGELRDPHNTFVLVGSEWGLIGLGLYLSYYATCFLILAQVRKRALDGGIWYYRSVAVQLSMVGIFVAGAFSDRLYAEAPMWMGALAVVLHRLQSDALAQRLPGGGVAVEEKTQQAFRPRASAVA